MTAYYDLVTAGKDAVLLADMKAYLKVKNTAHNTVISALIESATEYGEKYTGREFRANTWRLLLDSFTTRIVVNRSPVDTITSVKYLKAGVLTTVAAADYYIKQSTQCAEILLNVDKEWPTDVDEREQAIEITFVTKKFIKCKSLIDAAIKQHVAYVFYNRGDCPPEAPGSIFNSGEKSGADAMYNQFRISRI